MFQIFAINIVLISPPPKFRLSLCLPLQEPRLSSGFISILFCRLEWNWFVSPFVVQFWGIKIKISHTSKKLKLGFWIIFFLLLPDMFVTKKYKAVIVSHLPNTQTNSFNATICIDTHTSVSMNSPLEKQCEFFWIWAKQGPWKGKVSCLKLLIQCCFGQILNHYLYVVTNILVYWLFFFFAVICRHWIF